MFKKILFTGICFVGFSASAATCNGTTITAVDGTQYCWSTKTMNWWSAFAWCDAQGMKLVRMEEECYGHGSTPISGDGCPNFDETRVQWPTWMNFWTANTDGANDKAYKVGHYSSMVEPHLRTNLLHALCRL